MSNKNNRAILSAALIGVFAVTAPLAASAQAPQRGYDQAHQARPPSAPVPPQTRPPAPAPHQTARPAPAPAPVAQKHRPPQQVQQVGRYRITSTVNLRSGPGTQYRRAGQIRAGRIVQVDQVRAGWIHIRNQGWVSAQYARRA